MGSIVITDNKPLEKPEDKWEQESVCGTGFRWSFGRVSALISGIVLLALSFPIQLVKTIGKTITPYVAIKGGSYSNEVAEEWQMTASCIAEAFKNFGRFVAAPPKGYIPFYKEFSNIENNVISGNHLGKGAVFSLMANARNGYSYNLGQLNYDAKKTREEHNKLHHEHPQGPSTLDDDDEIAYRAPLAAPQSKADKLEDGQSPVSESPTLGSRDRTSSNSTDSGSKSDLDSIGQDLINENLLLSSESD